MIGVVVVALVVAAVVAPVAAIAEGNRVARVVGVATTLAGVVVAGVLAASTGPATGVVRAVCLTLVVVVAAVGAAPLVPVLFEIVRVDRTRTDPVATAETTDVVQPDTDTVVDDDAGEIGTPLRGGRIIGVLERVAVAVAVLAGWPEGIAVVLAVKGLARYPEIRDQHAGEQFIIGTFGSVLWALAVAGIGRLIVT